MSALDTLPADQRAVLQLILKQGRTYEQIASTLRISPDAVADRAYAALGRLGPEPADDLSEDQREEIGDYLLGQMSATGRRRVREDLEEHAGARSWARAVRSELRALAGDDLPEVPAEAQEVDEAFDALSARREAHERHDQKSKLGGILLLAALGLVLVGAILFATGVLGGEDDAAETPATTASTEQVTPVAQVNLQPPAGRESSALGVAFVVAGQGQQAIRVDAEGLPRTTRGNQPREGACIWLQADQRTEFVGCFREVSNEGTASASGVLPADVRQFPRLIVTRETGTDTPTKPGTTILTGEVVAPQTGSAGTATAPQGGAAAPTTPTTTTPGG